jgi:hypothetical protein
MLSYRDTQKFEDHAQVLMNLFCQYPSASTEDKPYLGMYIAGSTWRRMLHRVNHKEYSLPFFQALLNVKTFNYLPAPPRTSESRTSTKDLEILRRIPGIVQKTGHKFPHLEKLTIQLEGVESSRSASDLLYTEETCQEFHKVLCIILSNFHESLKDLGTLLPEMF